MRGRTLLMFLAFIFLMTISFSEEVAEKETPHPTLKALKIEITKILADFLPDAKIEFKDSIWLVAHYKTQKFMVHSIAKTGRISDEAHEEEGPNHEGILLNFYVNSGNQYLGSLVIPQTFREPYWSTYINAYSIPDRDEHVWTSLSYGIRVDPKMLEEIKAILAKIEK